MFVPGFVICFKYTVNISDGEGRVGVLVGVVLQTRWEIDDILFRSVVDVVFGAGGGI